MQKQKLVIIGNDSYLASGLDKYLKDDNVICLNYLNWKENINILREADCIINFSISPEFSANIIDTKEVIDVQIAELIVGYKPRYIFISSRKVYGISDECLVHNETSPIIGNDIYSINKINTEEKLQQILGKKLVILRPTNIIGEPILRKNYQTFMGWICNNYNKNGYIEADLNSNIRKDFITKDYLYKNIAYIMRNECSGIYNVSAGFGITIKYLLDGYVGDNVIYKGENKKLEDQFIVDNTKLKKLTGIEFSIKDIENSLKTYNKQLKQICKTPAQAL